MRKTIACLSLFLSTCLLLSAASPRPRSSVDSVLTSLESVKNFRETAISPDGSRVAWVEKIRDREGAELLSAIYVSDLSAGSARRIGALLDGRICRERDVAWSPDGASLAFLSDAAQPPQLDLYVVPATGGGPVRRVTRVTGQLQHPKWSPDGKTIAFLFTAGSTEEPGALVAYKPDSGLVGEKIEEQRIATADVASGGVREVSPENLYVYDYDWSPDGRRFAAEAAEGSGTNNYWIAELYTVETDSGKTRSLWKPPLQIACPRFSPDGKSIAVIHGIMSDEGSTGGDIWVVPAAGGQAKNLTPGMKFSASALFWRPTGEILFRGYADGQDSLARLDPATGRIDSLWTGSETLHGVSLARAGNKSAVIRDSFADPPEVHAGSIGAWKPMTHVNAKAARWWSDARALHWSSEGMPIQGWLLYPKDFDPSRRYPMVVSVHGGPSSCTTPGWPSRWNAVLPSQGFFVFLPNPRGSYGFGEAFTQGNVKDFGGGDLRDILAGVDEVVKTAPVDRRRLGVTGWSYGGYMVMWAVTQTERFRAAVAGAGIASWQSYYGQNKIDTWMLPFFGASVYDDPRAYAKSSPIEFIKNVKTPTLVLHGDRDSEVPTPQGYEFWHALKTLGVPTELVIYENEGHAITQRKHVRDIQERVVAWFEKYLKE
ncbi:MAG TPA: S9 family peptidase [Thermoanaerobaculia bacterium]|nr:S9 family peptidase [Thermoanaerobaculia bacterium]